MAWVYKGEWNGTLSDKLYVEARFGDFGYYFPLLSNGDATYGWRDTALGEIEGSYYTWQIDRDRKQTTGAATCFLDKGKGSHTFKFGGELLKETAWEGYLAQSGKDPSAPFGMIDHQYANGASTSVVFRIPTAINHLGGLKDNDNGNILAIANVGQFGAFLTDTWSLGRLTVNTGRYSRYRTVEASVNRRPGGHWSVAAGGSYTMLQDFPQGFPNTPNAPGLQERSTWDFKMTGSVDAPFGIKITPALRYQSGPNYARTISVAQSAATPYGLTYSGTIYAGTDGGDPGTSKTLWSFRQDNITVADVRIEKPVVFSTNVRVRLFLDVFNMFNSASYETINQATGTSFGRPSAILAPFTTRIGARFVF